VRELNADPLGADVRILFAIEPDDTVTLLAVLEGTESIIADLDDALGLAAELLDEIRADGQPDTTGEAQEDWLEFDRTVSFLERFFADRDGAIIERAAALATAASLAGLRQQRGVSLAALARATGISERRLDAIERDGPRSAALHELAAYLRQLGGRLELAASLDGQRRSLS
jgi:hypothetical protein